MLTEKIVKVFLEQFFWISLLSSLLLAWFSPARIKFGDQYEKHQRYFNMWINFVSGTIGWFSLYVFISYFNVSNALNLSFNHILLLVMGVLGLTGMLPKTLVNLLNAIENIVQKAANKL